MKTRHGRIRPVDDTAEAYLKGAVYAFVSLKLEKREGKRLERVLEVARYPYVSKPSFNENPFRYALFALRDPQTDVIKKHNVSKFGRQLRYAWRHHIPPQLLIGFLHQVGGSQAAYDKEGINFSEPWLAEYQEWGRRHNWGWKQT